MKRSASELLAHWMELKPLRDKAKDRLARKFSIEFNYNSNHIEGNTLTYGQTEVLLLFGKVIGEAKMRDLEEMKAHNIGLRMILDEACTDRPLTEMFIRQVHQTLLREDYVVHRTLPGGMSSSYTVHAGCYKTRPNSVITLSGERFEYASPEETPMLMTDLIQWYQTEEAKGELNPLELAAMFHYRYIRIHPFEDGNGRIARLIMNYILSRHQYPLIVVPSKSKQEYLSALSAVDVAVGSLPVNGARANLQHVRPFIDYLERLMVAEMQTDLEIATGSSTQWWFNGGWVSLKNQLAEEIICEIQANPQVSIRSLAAKVGVNTSAIQRHIKHMQEQGYLVRQGSVTRGSWHLLLTRL